MKRSVYRSARGFTLLEIMIVVLIIGLLIGMAVKNMRSSLDHAEGVRVKGDIEGYKLDLTMYQSMNGFLPTTEQGLKALVTRPESDPRPRNWRQQLTELRVDPWQQEYFYEQPGKHNPKSYDIYSAGPDRLPNTTDDIGNWESAPQ
jgi:general secretion pathway protein G